MAECWKGEELGGGERVGFARIGHTGFARTGCVGCALPMRLGADGLER